MDGQISREYVIVWEYDALDRVSKLIEEPGTAEEKVTSYTCDGSGRIATLTNPDGVVLAHAYDALGRLVTFSSSDGTVSYVYTYFCLELGAMVQSITSESKSDIVT